MRGFGKVWAEHQEVRDYVGCPWYPWTERAIGFTAQRFEGGIIFYTDLTGWFEENAVFVLFRDNMTWAKVIVPSWAQPEPIETPPAGRYAPQGRIAYAWQQGAGVRARLGWAIEPEKSGRVDDGTNGAWQAFERGYMYWIPWNLPDDRYIYVLSTYYPYPPGGARYDWLEFKDTWNP